MEKLLRYIREHHLLGPGDRVAVACSGGADSVALLRMLLELRETLGIVLSVAHFHHQIRGAEADEDELFVHGLARQFQLELHAGSADVPAYARERKMSMETAARESRHLWFAGLIHDGRADKIATAHTLDDQAETVLMRIVRGTGVRGLAGIAAEQKDKHLIRPLLGTSRQEIEAYLKGIGQTWRNDSSNLDECHTRNRVRHTLLPLLEREFNPAIRETLADLAEVARGEDAYWRKELGALLPRLVRPGLPSRSGRSTTGNASRTVALDLEMLRVLPEAVQRLALQEAAGQLGASLEFKHIQQLTRMIQEPKRVQSLSLPGGLRAKTSLRELRLSPEEEKTPANYQYVLPIPGEVHVPELGRIIRAQVISIGKQKVSGYNSELLLNRTRLAPKLTVRNWRAGDRFFPPHSKSPKKVKELLQSDRMGKHFSAEDRKLWPVLESAGQIVWMRGFSVAEAFAGHDADAVLIEEIEMGSGRTID